MHCVTILLEFYIRPSRIATLTSELRDFSRTLVTTYKVTRRHNAKQNNFYFTVMSNAPPLSTFM